MKLLTELQYMPCIRYFSTLSGYGSLIIDDLELFEKQSYRNRCTIAGANGPIDLIIPVHLSRQKGPVRDIKTDNHTRWQKIHWQSIRSAYGKTAYFLYYAHYFAPLYEKPGTYLFDFNLAVLHTILNILKMNTAQPVLLSAGPPTEVYDARNHIHPKTKFNVPDVRFVPHPYHQAFEEKYGFIPDLSIIDLIFNAGPDAGRILKATWIEE